MLLAQLSDIHFGTEDAAALDLARAQILEHRPDAVLVCGDLTQRGKRSEFQAAADWLDAFDMPVVCVPGNHDVPLLDIIARVTSPFDRFEQILGRYNRPLEVDGIRIETLNTARGWQARKNWAEGSVDLDDLAARLEGPPPADIIVCHHPFRSLPAAPLRTRTIRGERAVDLITRSGPRLLLTGHVHAPSSSVFEGAGGRCLAIAAGTMSTRLRSVPPSFNLVEVTDRFVGLRTYHCDESGGFMSGETRWDASTFEALKASG